MEPNKQIIFKQDKYNIKQIYDITNIEIKNIIQTWDTDKWKADIEEKQAWIYIDNSGKRLEVKK